MCISTHVCIKAVSFIETCYTTTVLRHARDEMQCIRKAQVRLRIWQEETL